MRLSLVDGAPGGSAASLGSPSTLRAAFTSSKTRVMCFFVLRFMKLTFLPELRCEPVAQIERMGGLPIRIKFKIIKGLGKQASNLFAAP